MPARPRLLAILPLVLLLTFALLAPVAQAQSSGEADCRNLPEAEDSGWTSYAQMVRQLELIETTSNGRVTLDVIGQSHQGRDLYAARVGTGDRVLLVTSEIHGNEKTGTEALLAILRHLASSGSPEAKAIRDGITLVAVPKFNADGAELNRRVNVQPWSDVMDEFGLANTPRAYYYSAGAGGFDVNRDFNADLTYQVQQGDLPGSQPQPGFYITPEARALRDLYVELRTEFGEVEAYVDLHHMGPCNRADGARPNLVTVDELSSAAGGYEAAGASFGPTPRKQGLDGDIVLVNDGSANPTLGCGPLVDFPAGAIALVDRGACSFVQKAANAQSAGARAMIVVNDRVGVPTNLGGNDSSITIPAVHVSQADGATIKAGLPASGSVAHHLGQYTTVALDFPPLGSEIDGNPRYTDWPLLDQDKSRRTALAAALGLQERAGKGAAQPSPFFGGVNQYIHNQVSDGYTSDRDFAGQARSAFGLNGTGSVLFEVRGQQHAWGQKQMGMLIQVVQAGVLGIAERMADGSIDTLDGDAFYDLPKYW